MSRSTAGLLALVALLAAVGAAIASSSPDGLQRVALDLGFDGRATTQAHYGPLSGLVGAAVVGGIAFLAGRLVARGR